MHVTGAGRRGSGHVVAPRLVLTSAHVVPEEGAAVGLLAAGEASPHPGRVVWRGTAHGPDDAALVEVTGTAWAPREGPWRWGRIVTNEPGIACRAWGFPDVVQREGRPVETSQPSGVINPGDRFVGDRYVMTLQGHPPEPVAGGSPWQGMSGAALVCDDLLVGVVCTDPAGRAHAALEAVPAYVLHHDPGFRAVLEAHGALSPLEPVELRRALLEDEVSRSPAALLRARRQVVGFHGREALLDELVGWCLDGSVFEARLLHGAGGQGKTRLAQELSNRITGARHRWAGLWLSPDAHPSAVASVKDVAVPLLVVVDYAETRIPQLSWLLRSCSRRAGRTPVRVLMLARTDGDWWHNLPAVDTAAGELLDTATATRVAPLAPAPGDRADEYRLAVADLARALPVVPGQDAVDWTGATDGLEAPLLQGPEWESTLSLHMRALADLLDAVRPRGPGAEGRRPVEDRLLEHEYRYWNNAADALGLGAEELREPLRDVLATAFVLGAADSDAADALIARVPGIGDQSGARRQQIRRWVSGLYPPGDGPGTWGGLQPDRILERFVGHRLRRNPHLFDPCMEDIGPDGAKRLISLYTRVVAHADDGLDRALVRFCVRFAHILGPIAVDVATQVETPGPLIAALYRLVDDVGTPVELLEHMSSRIPVPALGLTAWAVRLSEHLVGHHRSRAPDDPGAAFDLAGSLHAYAVRLREAGRHEGALEAITEAVVLRRGLASYHPDAHLPDLAESLANQSVDLRDMGRHEEALDIITEAVTIRRGLVSHHPDAHLPDLAGSLNKQAVLLGLGGRYAEALADADEAVRICRGLVGRDPARHSEELARALHGRASLLGRLGRNGEALAAASEAVRIREVLVARQQLGTGELAASRGLYAALAEG
ncbi:tetratricopeptide repeat protein [Nocardiopsis tropica]|uniref:Tetratricopeptide repeat protein n=1 Tax=Nocardiopsis tropica TaxID=109330 RepID=A0ABV1ZXC0_9ACTN